MANYDGDITLSVNLTPGDVKSTTDALRSEIKRIFSSTAGTDTSKSFKQLEARMAKSYDKAGKLLGKIQQLENTSIPTKEFELLDKELEKLLGQFGQLSEKKEKFLATGGSEGSKTYARMQYDMNQIDKNIESVYQQREQLRQSMSASILGENTPDYANLISQLQEVNNQMTIYTQQAATSPEMIPSISGWSRLASVLGTVASVSAKCASNLLRMAGGAVIGGIKKLASSMADLGKHTKSSNSLLKTGLRFILRYGLGVRSTYMLVRKLRKALGEGIGNLAQYSSPFNDVISDLISSLTRLKNAFATAFAPIINVVAPLLTGFINMVSEAVTRIGMLIAALTGQSTFIRAKTVQEDFAASLDKSAGSADDATKAAKEYQKTIAGFDDVEILKNPDNDSSGSGGGGGGAGGSGISPQDMFETVTLDSMFTNWADKIKEAWEKADFTEIGKIVGEKLADSLNNIQWTNIQGTAERFSKSFATFINGAISVTELAEAIGSTIAQSLNTVLTTIHTFVTTLEWGNLGNFIATGINTFFNTYDFEKADLTFTAFVTGIFTLLKNAVQNLQWVEIAKNIISGFAAIDWGATISSVTEFAGSAAGALASLVASLFSGLGTAISEYFADKANQHGGDIILGIFSGIADFFLTIGTWIKTNILDPFVTGFKNTFGIHSPASESSIVELGKNLIAGIFQGVIDWFAGIGDWIKTNVLTPFQTEWSSIFGENGLVDTAISIAVGIVKDAANWVADAWTAVSKMGSKGVATVQTALKKAGTWISDAWTAIQKGGSSATATIQAAVEKAETWVTDAWNAIKKGGSTAVATIQTAVEKAGTWVADAWTALRRGGSELVTTVKTAVEKAQTWVTDAWNALKSGGGSAVATIKAALEKAETWVSDAWTAIQKGGSTATATIKAAVEKAQTWVTDAWNALKSGGGSATATIRAAVEKAETWISDAWLALKSGGQTITTTIKTAVEKAQTWVTDAWNVLRTGGSTATVTILTALEKAQTWIEDAWTAVKAGGKTAVATLQAKVEDAADTARDVIQTAWTTIVNTTSELKATVIDKSANGVINTLVLAYNTIVGGVKTLVGKVTDTSDSGVIDRLKNAYAVIIGGVKTLVGKVTDNSPTGAIDTLKGAYAVIIGGAKTLIGKVENKSEAGVIGVLKDAYHTIVSGYKTLYAKVKDESEKGVIDTLKDAYRVIVGGAKTLLAKVQDNSKYGVIDTLIDAWTTIKKKSAKLTAKVANASKSTLSTISKAWNYIRDDTRTMVVEFINRATNVLDEIMSAIKAIFNAPSYKRVEVDFQYKYPNQESGYNRLFSAKGGALFGGMWHNIAQYATGGAPRHGTMFVAGEAGAEVVGHIGGRTEILNQSQMASVMYSAVLRGTASLMHTVTRHMSLCTNTIISNIGSMLAYLNLISTQFTDLQNSNSILTSNLNDIVTGKIIPSAFGMTNNSTDTTLNKILSMLQYNQNNLVTKDELFTILRTMFEQYMNIGLYIGDEQIARHANAGNAKLNYRFNPVAR